MPGNQIRAVLLEVVNELSKIPDTALQSGWIIEEARKCSHLDHKVNIEDERALLTHYYDLFRIGYLAWGHNFSNPSPPFCHVTEQGRKALANVSRDPANPDGYLQSLNGRVVLSPITKSYLTEALSTYNSGSFKATAVMIGVAAESIVLDLRDAVSVRLDSLGQPKPNKLGDWRIKTVLDALESLITQKKKDLPKGLYEHFESYWAAFTQQIRTVRNESGHPISIEPVSQDMVHASLLIFPELAVLAKHLTDWINTSYT